MLEITTLGRGSARMNGTEIAGIVGQKQKFALLVYVALEGPVSRDRLVALFWPERDEERARHSLSQALYSLRKDLGSDDFLQVDTDSVYVLDGNYRVDALQLEKAADVEDWDMVVDLYRGGFLDDFGLTGAPEFEKWQSNTHTRVARLARKAFRRVIERKVAASDLAGALATASRWATLDPLEDEAQHTYITLLARSGDRTGALRQFDAYRSLLASELDVEPLDGTIALVERIGAGELPEYRPLAELTAPGESTDEGSVTEVRPASLAPTEELRLSSLLSELRKRRVLYVGAAYLVVAWLAMQFAGSLAEYAILPNWVVRVTLFFLFVGFPFAIILAWAQEEPRQASGEEPTHSPWPHWAERIRGGQVLRFLGVMVVALLAGWWLSVRFLSQGVPGQNRATIMVFPPEVMPEGNDGAGEGFHNQLIYALEATGPFISVDGLYGLEPGETELNASIARSRAENFGSAYYLRARIRLAGDSVWVSAELTDVARKTVASRASSAGELSADWTRNESLKIALQLLRPIMPDDAFVRLRLFSDSPQATQHFNAAETAYRQARFAEALEHYRKAVEEDSTYSLAALKGAAAACWLELYDEAARLVDVALRRRELLPQQYVQFGEGLRDYLHGHADSAVAHFRLAVTISPVWWEAWARLGEVYTHQLPRESPLDSLAREAFLRVHRGNPLLAHVLIHLVQLALRDGDTQQAAVYLQQLRDAGPDSTLLRALELEYTCVETSPDLIDWRGEARADPWAVYAAAQSMAKGALQADCARAGWSALVSLDRAGGDGDGSLHFGSLLALQSLLVAEGRYEDVIALVESDVPYSRYARDFYILDAAAGADLGSKAQESAKDLEARVATSEPFFLDYWLLGIWSANSGNAERANDLADSLAAMAGRTGDRVSLLMARSIAARAALAAGDSAGALRLLRALAPTATPADIWNPWETIGGEYIALAELLYAAGDYEDALRIAANLGAPARQPVDLVYLPASLAVQAKAARKLGYSALEQRCKDRLAALGRVDLLAELSN